VDSGERVKVLVTGATGFVASHLIPALAQRHDVVALGHDGSRIPAVEGVTPLVVDLRSVSAGELPPVDAIVHLAQANVPFPDGALDLQAVNTAATVALLDHARAAGASHFVFASSASVYGFGDEPWSEDDVPAATDFYSATKLAGERFVQAYAASFGTTILRLVAPYGPGQRNRMIPRLVDSVREGRAITLNEGARPRMNPIYVDDVVRVIEASLGSSGHELVNAAGDEAASIRELAESIGRAVGVEPVFEQGTGTAGDIVCRNDRMREAFSLGDLIGLDEGLARTAAGVPARA
jgi:nucleoside-diphosphate-sugar epimerase